MRWWESREWKSLSSGNIDVCAEFREEGLPLPEIFFRNLTPHLWSEAHKGIRKSLGESEPEASRGLPESSLKQGDFYMILHNSHAHVFRSSTFSTAISTAETGGPA